MPATEKFFSPSELKEAYKKYKEAKSDKYSNRVKIPMGADGVTWKSFEANLDKNIEKISGQVLNNKYHFYPLREKDIPKPFSQKKRTLSIACIRDVLVQKQLYKALINRSEEIFTTPKALDHVSLAYRKNKSIRDAARGIWKSFKRDGFRYALDADLEKFFDTLDHGRLEQLIEKWFGMDSIEGVLLCRYLHVGRIPYAKYKDKDNWKKDFKRKKRELRAEIRERGIPQGGVLSGLLANLYLYDFDKWVVIELPRITGIKLRYYRYADDFVVLTKSFDDAAVLFKHIEEKLESLKLKIHPLEDNSKTKIVDLAVPASKTDVEKLEFVGFEFTDTHIRIKHSNIKNFQNRLVQAIKKETSLLDQPVMNRLDVTIQRYVNKKITGPKPELCEICGKPQDKYRNWIGVFAPVVTDTNQIKQLDRWIRRRISKHFLNKYQIRISRKQLREAGLESLIKQYYKQRIPVDKCQCNHEVDFT